MMDNHRMSLPPILLIHGAGGGAWEWNVWLRVLAARGLIAHAFDLMPVGVGPSVTTLADYRAQVAAVAAAMDAPPVLVGASLGGLLAAMVAAQVRAPALVMINPLPPSPWNLTLPVQSKSAPVISWANRASIASTRRALPDADETTCEFAWRRWRDESGAVVDAARGGVVVERPPCPLLVMASEADEEVPVSVSVALACEWDGSLLRLPACSHVGPLLGRRAAAHAGLVLAWLDSLFS